MESDKLSAAGLRYDVDGAVATITLNRPQARNAQSPQMWRTLAELGAGLPESIRVVVLRGAGHSFSAGLDRAMLDPATSGDGPETVVGLLGNSDAQIADTIGEYQEAFTFLRNPRFISIAAVQGYAIGAGFQLALSCDLRIAAQDAQFSMKESALGLVPDLTGTKPLVEAVGYARALEICATARMVGAAEAERIGLVLDVTATDGLDDRVAELARALCEPLPGVVQDTKVLLQAAGSSSLADQALRERQLQVQRMRELARHMGG